MQVPEMKYLAGLVIATHLVWGALPGVAEAAPLQVTAIPWVQENPDIPHVAINGLPTQLQAIAEGGTCNGAYTYQWDWDGNGTYDDAPVVTAANQNAGYYAALPKEVQYPNAAGDRLYYPKVKVTCGGETATAIMPVLIRVDRMCSGYAAQNQCTGEQSLSMTRTVYADRAVARGLWWLFRQFTHRTDDAQGHANTHTCWVNSGTIMYETGHALNALLRRGHGYGVNRDADPYYRHATQCGIHGILANLTQTNLGAVRQWDDVATPGTDGKSLYMQGGLYGDSSYTTSYVASAWIEPVANFGNPDYVSPVGRAGVFGVKLRDIGQDVADRLVDCMGANGWWHYQCGNNSVDCSTNGWAPESLRFLRRKFGTETYKWAQDAQRAMLNANTDARGCNYQAHAGFQANLSGNGLVGYGWTENEVFDPNNVNVAGLMTAVRQVMPASYGLYYIYAATKGLRAFTPEIQFIGPANAPVDWNVEYTKFLLAQQLGDGSWNWGGNWSWAGSVGNPGRTAMIIQIIQSWLEAYAYPRAIPQLASPGTEITFDHSWSYVLDPAISITKYQWNVIDYLADIDLNEDGDCTDEGEHCSEDLNENGVIDPDEIVWDFETDQKGEQFFFSYDDRLNWDQTISHKVTLRVTDSMGRTVDNSDTVQIQISLLNHAPVIVSHPEGPNASYTGYAETEVILDGRASYDADSDQEVFPGDPEGTPNRRPAGIRDRITSIRFDLNFDGDYTDPGEDGTAGPVKLILHEAMAIGDKIAVPMQVCDDGQWNGKCYDGVTRPDCSMCAYGSASIHLVQNLLPPDVVVEGCEWIEPEEGEGGDGEGEPAEAGYWLCTAPGAGPAGLDLSGSSDPEGVLGLTYTYTLVEGHGTFQVAPEYQGNPDDMGPNVKYVPESEGTRTDTIQVTVCDAGKPPQCIDVLIRINVPNTPPVIDDFQLSFEPRAPIVQRVVAEQLGNGRVRLTVVAVRDDSWDAYGVLTAHDQGVGDGIKNETLVYEVDVDGDGEVDGVGDQDDNKQRLEEPIVALGGTTLESDAVVTDSEGLTDTAELSTEVPLNDATLSYWFDLDGDRVFEAANSATNSITIEVEGDAELLLTGFVTDSNGKQTDFEQGLLIDNQAPVIETVQVVQQGDTDVVVIVGGWDPEGDTTTFTVDFGDGSPPVTVRGGVATHTYPPESDQTYTITVTADDGQGGRTEETAQVSFENEAPVVERVVVTRTGDWGVAVNVGASDADGDALTYTFDFGDGSEPVTSRTGLATHEYEEDSYGTRTITVTVTDGRGHVVTRETTVTFTNTPPVVDEVRVVRLGGWNALITVAAHDADNHVLTYTIDFGDDSAPLVSASGVTQHVYPAQLREYTIRVTVDDGHGGQDTGEAQLSFTNEPPVVNELRLVKQEEWGIVAFASATDPDGDPLTYTFDFGDGSEPVNNGGGVEGHTYPADVYRTYTVTVTVRDGHGGEASTTAEVDFPRPAENEPPVITEIQVNVGYHGRVQLVVEAYDPEDGPVTARIHWGDEAEGEEVPQTEPLVGLTGNHEYAYPALVDNVRPPYVGYVVVADREGATAQEEFQAEIKDAPTVIRQVVVSVVRQGIVLVDVAADDPDGRDGLVYAFDFDTDGTIDVDDQASPSAIHTYELAGNYPIRVQVTDTWSMEQTTADTTLDLPPWEEEVLDPDHLDGEEGRCMVFRVDASLAEFETKYDPAACERVYPTEGEYVWNFGDGSPVAAGTEVGHQYVDDGVYHILVTGGTVLQPRRSVIQLLVANVAPTFRSQPPALAKPGATWQYDVVLADPGLTDQVQLAVESPAELGLQVVQGQDDRHWTVTWAVPADFQAEQQRIVLRAIDGHTINGAWTPDGGSTLQQFVLTVQQPEANCWDDLGDVNGDGLTDWQDCWAATHPDAGTPDAGTPDSGIQPEPDLGTPDSGVVPDPLSLGGASLTDGCECATGGGATGSLAALTLLALLGLGLLRRR